MKIQLKRSNVLDSGAAKTPSADQLEYGEIAINYNNNDPSIFMKDSTNNVIRISGENAVGMGQTQVPIVATAPSNPVAGNQYFDTDDNRLYVYTGSAWVRSEPLLTTIADLDVTNTLDISGTANFTSNVGFGVASPSHALDISNASNAYIQQTRGSSTLRLGPAGDQAGDGAIIGTDTSGPLRFYTNGSSNERLRIDTEGRVGINEVSPVGILHVKEGESGVTPNTTHDTLFIENDDDGGITIGSPNNKSGYLAFADPQDNDIAKIQYAHTDNQLSFTVNAGVKAVINSTGNFGINTTSPSRKLEVVNDDDYALKVGGTTSGGYYLELGQTGTNGSAGIKYLGSGGSLKFSNVDGEVARFDPDGDFGIGGSPTSTASTKTLQITDSTTARMLLESTGSGGRKYGWYTSVDGQLAVYDYTANAERIRVTSSGNFGINETNPSANLVVRQSGSTFTAQSQTVALFQRSSTTGHGAKIAIVAGTAATSDINFGDTDDEDAGLIRYAHTNNSFTFCTASNTTSRLTIDSSGNITIPGNLTVNGSFSQPSGDSSVLNSASVLQVGTTGNFDLELLSNNNKSLVVKNTGNVGIGTTSPTSIYGTNLNINDASSSALHLTTDNSGTGNFDGFHIINSSGIAYLWNRENTATVFATNNDEKMRIDSSGRLLVGTTTEGHANADELTIANSADTGITLRSGTNGYANIYFSDATSGAGEYVGYIQYWHGDDGLRFGTAGLPRLTITGTGNAEFGGSATFASGNFDLASYGALSIKRTDGNNYPLFRWGTDTNYSGGGIYPDGSATFASNAQFGTAAADARITIGSHGTAGTNDSVHVRADSQNLLFMSGSGGVTKFEQNGTQRLLIDSAGNVIVGASQATNAEFTIRAAAPQLSLYATPGNITRITMGDTDDHDIGIVGYDNSTNAMFFNVNNGTRLTIDSTGNAEFGGSASFAGFVDFTRNAGDGFGYIGIGPGGSNEKATFVNRGGEIDLELYSNFSGSPTVSINSDGSATFGPTSGSYVQIAQNTGVTINDGAIDLYQATSNVNAEPFKVHSDVGGTKVEKVAITAKGDVIIGPYNTTPYLKGMRLFPDNNGRATIVLNGDGSNNTAFGIYDGNTSGYTTKLFHDGTAGFGATNNTSYDGIAQTLLVADESGNAGITIRSGGESPYGAIHFADGTTGNAQKRAGRIYYAHGVDSMIFATANDEALRINSGGHVGIGTTDPGAALEIYRDTSPGIRLNDGGDYKAYMQLVGNDLEIRSSSGQLEFYTGSADGASSSKRLTITSTGNAEFGGNVDIGALNPSSTTVGGVATFASGALYIQRAASGSANDKRFIMYHGATQTASITAGGAAEFAGTVESTKTDSYVFKVNGGGLYANGSSGNSLYIKDGSSYPVGVWNDSNDKKLVLGGGASSTYNITLNGDNGDATITGQVVCGNTSSHAGHGVVGLTTTAAQAAVLGRNTGSYGVTLEGRNNNNDATFIVDAVGRTRLGSSPTTGGMLNVKAASGKYMMDLQSSADGLAYITFRRANGTITGYLGNANGIVASGNEADFALRGQTHLVFATNGNSERMRITSTGRVGINVFGNTGAGLHVDNVSGTTGFGSPIIKCGSSTSWTGNGTVYSMGFGYVNGENVKSPAEIGLVTTSSTSSTKGDLFFATRDVTSSTAPTERMRIDSSGRVGIGKSSSLGAKLHIQDDSATETTLIKLRNYKASVNTQAGILFECSTSGNQGGNSLIKGVCGTDAGGSNSQNDGGLAFQTGSGGSGTLATRLLLTSTGNAEFAGAITSSSLSAQTSATSSWFQTGTSISGANYVWAAKNSSSGVWHSGLQTDGDLYLGGDLTSDANIGLQGSTGKAFFTNNVGIGTTNPVHQAGIGLHIHNASNQARIKLTQSGSGATANDGFDIIAETGNDIHLLNHESASLKFGTGDSEKMRLDEDGRLLVGTTDSRASVTTEPYFQIEGSSANEASMSITRNGGANPPYLQLVQTGGSTDGSLTATPADATLGQIIFGGSSGSQLRPGAYIAAKNDSNSVWGTYCPTHLAFSVTRSDAHSPTEAMRIDSSGKVYFGNFADVANAGYIDKATTGDYELNIVASRSTAANRDIVFKGRSNTEAMRIESGGNVKFKTAKKGIFSDGTFSLANDATTTFNIGYAAFFVITVTNCSEVTNGTSGAFFANFASSTINEISDPFGDFTANNNIALTTGVTKTTNSSVITIRNDYGASATYAVAIFGTSS